MHGVLWLLYCQLPLSKHRNPYYNILTTFIWAITVQARVLWTTLINIQVYVMWDVSEKAWLWNQTDLDLNLGTCCTWLVWQLCFTRLSKNQAFLCLVTLLSLVYLSRALICIGQDSLPPHMCSKQQDRGRERGRLSLPFKDTAKKCIHLFCSHPIVQKVVTWLLLAGREARNAVFCLVGHMPSTKVRVSIPMTKKGKRDVEKR